MLTFVTIANLFGLAKVIIGSRQLWKFIILSWIEKIEPQRKIGDLMQCNTPHGLKPANDFLNMALSKDVGTIVSLDFLEVNTRFQEKYYCRHWIKRDGDNHRIELPVQQISWEN